MAPKTSKKSTSKSETASKTLVIAEKPSVAKDLAKALPGKFKDNKTFLEGSNYIVSYAIGHLVTICTPAEIDEVHKQWALDNLPIIPDLFPLKAIKTSKSQLVVLSKLIRRRDVKTIVNACDAGREGELIFRYILKFVLKGKSSKKQLRRLWLQSLTKEAIIQGFKNLREDGDMKNLEAAALCRSEADWLIGINGSRALTAYKSRYGGFRLTPCGRVQTPTVSMIVQREEQIKNFVPKDYWEIEGLFDTPAGDFHGRWIKQSPKAAAKEKIPKAEIFRIWSKDEAQAIFNKCLGKPAKIKDESKPTAQNSPPLYDLTSIQREANNRFGFSAKMTLDIMQSLYDRHKVITYPRTGSRFLPENYIETAKQVAQSLSGTVYSQFARQLISKNWIKPNKRIFNNAKVSDHYAVVPTSTVASNLSETEQKIYDMIARRFLAVFYPPCRSLNISRISEVEGEIFLTEGKIIQDPGWRIVYGVNAKEESVLPENKPGDSILLNEMKINKDSTKPPPRFTESTLLSMMESAGKLVDDDELKEALKERGLGTPATRAAIIEGLIKDKYIVRQAKELIPTTKASELLETISAIKIEELMSPEMTGEWEYRLEQISKGQQDRQKFMSDIRTLTNGMVDKIKDFDEEAIANKTEVYTEPNTNLKIYETLSFYESEDKSIRIKKFLGGRFITHDEIKLLLAEKKLGPFSNFVSKAGKQFTAMIKLDENSRAKFVFEDIDQKKPDFNALPCIGTSPVDGSKVYEAELSYISESIYERGCKTGLKINKVILGQKISSDNVKLMLNGKKTNLIKAFRSPKTKKLFDAYLYLPKSGKIAFSFPPRGRFKSAKKAAPRKTG